MRARTHAVAITLATCALAHLPSPTRTRRFTCTRVHISLPSPTLPTVTVLLCFTIILEISLFTSELFW